MIDYIALHTIYSDRLSVLVNNLPIPKSLKMRFLLWQFTQVARIAIKRMVAQQNREKGQ